MTVSRRRLLQAGLVLAGGSALTPVTEALTARPAYAAGSGWPYFRTDPHVHSVISGDAVDDAGVLGDAAGAGHGLLPYDVVFLTDHHRGSSFLISGEGADNGTWDGRLSGASEVAGDAADSTAKWAGAQYGSGTFTFKPDPTHVLSPSPHPANPFALLLRAQSPSYGEAMAWRKRGPSLMSGSPSISFSVFPTRIDPGCTIYVSAAIGGDPTTPYGADGYTRKGDGAVRPGVSHVFTWQLGATVAPLGYPAGPSTTVHSAALGAPVLSAWNAYRIDVSGLLALVLGTSEAPLDYNALIQLKMAVTSSAGGFVEVWFDGWKHTATSLASAEEFRRRNVDIARYTGPVSVVPSIELGVQQHVQRFNFPDATAWKDYQSGTGVNPSGATINASAVTDVQTTGYPAQLNHPGLPGGPPTDLAKSTNAFGADIMEACTRGTNAVMIDIWDAILAKGVPLVGSWSSDAHRVASLKPCTYLQAPSKSFDDLMQSFFEGRAFMANRDFTGRVAFNVAATDSDSFPARFPVYVPATSTTAVAHLAVSAGVRSGSTLRWVVNGALFATQAVSGPSLERTLAVPLATTGTTYARAELLDSAGSRYVMTQAIFYAPLAGLPNGSQFRVTRVTNRSRPVFTRTMTKGITSASYDNGTGALTATLTNVASSLVELDLVAPGFLGVSVDGTAVPPAGSLSAYQGATTSTWFSSGGHVLLKVLHATGTAQLTAQFGGDSTAPTSPGGVTAVQTASGPVLVSWNASTDDIGVAEYVVSRNGASLATVGGGTTSYTDPTTTSATSYGYTVVAVDGAGNASPPSTAVTITTRAGDTTTTLTAVADAYVQSTSPSSNFGSAPTLRVDGDGIARSYLKFAVPALGGSVVSATLRLFPTTSQSPGVDVYAETDTSWTEGGITWSNAPVLAASSSASTGKATASAWLSADVSALVPDALARGGGSVGIGLATVGTTALSLSSRQGANAPQLVLVTTTAAADTTAPSVPSGLAVVQDAQGPVQLTWSASSDDRGVVGYTVYRNDGVTVTVPTPGYSDQSTAPSTGYQYAVDAVDGAGNRSLRSGSVSITTRPASTPMSTTVVASADSYVSSASPDANFGTATTLKVDADGIFLSYLRFALDAQPGTLVSATLQVYANTAQSTGYDVYDLVSDTWTESTLTYNNRPALVSTRTGSSGRVTWATWTAVDVTSLVRDRVGPVSVGLSTTSTTALSLSSRSGAQPPRLVIVSSP